ncbi:ATP-dependent helicase [Candidatus Uhrbacteria bacterium]|nr:ATP-dependent helicase [Candidatus Uhrbacteria bacterium]
MQHLAAAKIDYKKELNAEQYAVVSGGDGPCLVLAGAGSGKTRTIVYRVAYLIEHGVRPEEILLLTFTNKAAAEMMSRIAELTGGDSHARFARGQSPWGGTFHSIANRILRAYGTQIGFTPNFTILDQEDSRDLVKACIRELGYDNKTRRFPSASVIQSVLSYARNAMRPLDETVERKHPGLSKTLEEIGRVAELYMRKKRQANAMDFDDMLEHLSELLTREPMIRAALSRRFRYVLVDEYQDTNRLQAAIVRQLASHHNNVLVVGDDAQSIYSFRAAEIRNILDFSRDFPGAKTFRLETNYRSTPEILNLANEVIAKNTEQFPKELRSVRPPAVKPMVAPAASTGREAEYVADRIAELLESGVPAKEIAVLFRAAHHSQALEFELMKRNLAYDYRGGIRFFERAHVKDALALLRVSANIVDEAAWLRLLRIQTGIGDVSAAKVFGLIRAEGSLAKVIQAPIEMAVSNKAAAGWRDLRALLEDAVAAEGRAASLVRAVLDSAYVEYLENEYPDARERLDDLEELARFAEGYEAVGDFLAEIALDDAKASGRNAGKINGVVLSTIHQAKGLEWEAVFIIHLNDAGFPNRRAAAEDGGLEEERRLFYVAVTRAKKHLTLSYPATVARDSFELAGPSMFLEEIDQSSLDRSLVDGAAGGTDDWPVYEEPAIQAGDEFAAIAKRMKNVRK